MTPTQIASGLRVMEAAWSSYKVNPDHLQVWVAFFEGISVDVFTEAVVALVANGGEFAPSMGDVRIKCIDSMGLYGPPVHEALETVRTGARSPVGRQFLREHSQKSIQMIYRRMGGADIGMAEIDHWWEQNFRKQYAEVQAQLRTELSKPEDLKVAIDASSRRTELAEHSERGVADGATDERGSEGVDS